MSAVSGALRGRPRHPVCGEGDSEGRSRAHEEDGPAGNCRGCMYVSLFYIVQKIIIKN